MSLTIISLPPIFITDSPGYIIGVGVGGIGVTVIVNVQLVDLAIAGFVSVTMHVTCCVIMLKDYGIRISFKVLFSYVVNKAAAYRLQDVQVPSPFLSQVLGIYTIAVLPA